MECARVSKDQSRVDSDRDGELVQRLDDYRLQLQVPRKIPQTIVPILLEKGRSLVELNPERFESTARALMDSARHMHPFEATRFLREKVTSETFEFQARFEELRAPSDLTLSGVCGIHVNTVPRFLNLVDSEMAPISKRFKSGWDREDPESYRVCFATGRIDPLSQFLVGHALLRRPIETEPRTGSKWERNQFAINLADLWALEPTQQRFAEKFGIAVLSGNGLPEPEDYLDILSPVRSSPEPVDFIGVTEPTKVRVEWMPHTILLPEQIAELKEESGQHLRGAVRQDSRIDLSTFPDQYVVAAHAELGMKFRLIKVYESLRSDTTTAKGR